LATKVAFFAVTEIGLGGDRGWINAGIRKTVMEAGRKEKGK
jgi:hypothetical protein